MSEDGDADLALAILQSGTAVGPPLNDTRWYQPIYNRVTAATGFVTFFLPVLPRLLTQSPAVPTPLTPSTASATSHTQRSTRHSTWAWNGLLRWMAT